MAGHIKICGLRDADTAVAAAASGASLLGFVFFRKSPRYIDAGAAEAIVTEVKQASFERGFEVPGFVGLFVDGGESALAEAAPFLTHFQLHGHESPERCAAVGAEFGLGIIKAVSVAGEGEVAAARNYDGAADFVLFDARAPKGAERPGGNGAPFDWRALAAYGGQTPFLLAGGLTPETVASAIGAAQGLAAFGGVDVSSGVEARPGEKDPARVAAFIRAARGAFTAD